VDLQPDGASPLILIAYPAGRVLGLDALIRPRLAAARLGPGAAGNAALVTAGVARIRPRVPGAMLFGALGAASLVPYVLAWRSDRLLDHLVTYEVLFLAASRSTSPRWSRC